MSIPMEDMEKTRREIASGNDEDYRSEPKVYESGYFLLSQQINSLRDSMDAKFSEVRKETDIKFSDFRKEIEARFDKVDIKFDKVDVKFDNLYNEIKEVRKEINGLQKWSFALIVTIILGFTGVIGTLVTVFSK